jgi:predicted nucleic acid-binding protein
MRPSTGSSVYFDTCIIGNLVKQDASPADIAALRTILDAANERRIDLVASTVAREEINKIPEQYRLAHETIYSLLSRLPGSRVTWVEETSTGGARVVQDPRFTDINQVLRDENDSRHFFQAVDNQVDFFLTTDQRSVLNQAPTLEQRFTVRPVSPTQLVKALGLSTPSTGSAEPPVL